MNPATQDELFSGGVSSTPEAPKEPRPVESKSKQRVEEDRPLAPYAPVVIKAPDMTDKPKAESKPVVEEKAKTEIKREPTTKSSFNPETKPKMSNPTYP